MDLHYTVVGKWPFPRDMLRRDMSVAASEWDRAAIDALTGDQIPDGMETGARHEIHLVIPEAVRAQPNAERWQSFGWMLKPSGDGLSLSDDNLRRLRMETLRRQALAKLTAEEREALAWFSPEFKG